MTEGLWGKKRSSFAHRQRRLTDLASQAIEYSEFYSCMNTIVVLGGPLSEDGRPGAWLAARLVAAATLFRALRAAAPEPPTVVCSGASGEAEAMVRALAAQGVPQERCLRECRARNTLENALYAQEAIAADMVRRWGGAGGSGVDAQVFVVTSDFHMRRAATIFSRVFGGGGGGGGASASPVAASDGGGTADGLIFVSAPTAAVGEAELAQLQYRERVLLARWWPAARRVYRRELHRAGAPVRDDTPALEDIDLPPPVRDLLARLEGARRGEGEGEGEELSGARKTELLWAAIEDADEQLRAHALHGAKHGDASGVGTAGGGSGDDGGAQQRRQHAGRAADDGGYAGQEGNTDGKVTC